MRTFWKPDLTYLGGRLASPLAMVGAECDVAPIFSTKRRTTTEQKQSRIRKVATLARSGERGRALAADRNAPPVPVTQIVQVIKSLYPIDPDPAASALKHWCRTLFLSEVSRACSNHTS